MFGYFPRGSYVWGIRKPVKCKDVLNLNIHPSSLMKSSQRPLETHIRKILNRKPHCLSEDSVTLDNIHEKQSTKGTEEQNIQQPAGYFGQLRCQMSPVDDEN